MLPSFVVCLVATGLIAWLTWSCVPRHLLRPVFVGLSGGLWLVQGVRWGYRYFGYNYRLTTRRLFRQRGFRQLPEEQMDLTSIARVAVRSNWHERKIGVGEVVVWADDPSRPPMVLKGLRRPERVAEMLRAHVQVIRSSAAKV
jgi:hypothetical protein